MITVPEVSEKIINRSRYLSEALSKDIINISALARYIKPEIEQILDKKVSYPAVVMALNRLAVRIKPKYVVSNIFKTPPDMIVHSNLMEISVSHSKTLIDKYPLLLKLSKSSEKHFFIITEGFFETTIIANKNLKNQIKETLKNENVVEEFGNLSSITIRLPKEAVTTPGILYFFLKSLAWEGINIIEIVSAHLELTIVLAEKDTNKAFAIVQSLFSKEI